MRLQIFKDHREIKKINTRLEIKPLSIELIFETPERLKLNDKLEIRLSTGDNLSFMVEESLGEHKYSCLIETMQKLDGQLLISATPNTPMSRIVKSEFSGILEGGLKKDYTNPNLAFSGTLWELIGLIERKTDSRAFLTKTGMVFDPFPTSLTVGKEIASRAPRTRRNFTLENFFTLLPAKMDGLEVTSLTYDFTKKILRVNL